MEDRARYATAIAEAGTLLREGRIDAAIARLDAMLAERPREPQARFLRGVADAERGNVEAATATFRALVADYPELPEPWNNLAVFAAQKGDYAGALQLLESALRAAPGWSVALENLGDVHLRLAAEAYDRAAKADATSKSVPRKLAQVRELLAGSVPAR